MRGQNGVLFSQWLALSELTGWCS